MNKSTEISNKIENRIFTIRGIQVMLDNHLGELYGVETKIINKATNRNLERFPTSFRFQLTEEEDENLRFQIGTSNSENSFFPQNLNITPKHGGRRYLPYVFTEQGVAMLSAILRSETAMRVSILIMDAFVEMRKVLNQHAGMFQRLDKVENKLLENDNKFEQVFKALENRELNAGSGLFFDGQVFDAWTFVSDLVRSAKSSLILIDNYVDDSVLKLLTKRDSGITATIYTKTTSKQLATDLLKHNSQYAEIEIHEMTVAHDRFLIIDRTELYHIGASLKDLEKKCFAFSKMDEKVVNLLNLL